jgi:hypothetical protein
VGLDHHQTGAGLVLRVLLEKDFASIDRPGGEDAGDAYAFAIRSATC